MRDIKFRAWDKKTKVMIPFTNMWICDEYSSLSFDGPDGSEYVGIDALPGGWHDDSPIESFYEIMQYTGLKDKNGKEIYEGDIVRVYYNDKFKGGVAVIRYLGRSFCMSQAKDDTELDCVWFNICEVIGNVYESPELLEDKN